MKFIYVLILSLFLMQCSSVNQAPDSLEYFLRDVFNEPSKLLEIEKNFPNLVVDSLLDSQMKDRAYINGVISFIASEFTDEKLANNAGFFHSSAFNNILTNYDFRQIINSVSINDIYVQLKSNSEKTATLELCWIKVENRFVLYRIEYGRVAPL